MFLLLTCGYDLHKIYAEHSLFLLDTFPVSFFRVATMGVQLQYNYLDVLLYVSSGAFLDMERGVAAYTNENPTVETAGLL